MSRQQRVRAAQRRASLYGGDWRDYLKKDEVRAAVFYGDAEVTGDATDDSEETPWDPEVR